MRQSWCYLGAPFSPPASPSHLQLSPLFPFWLRWITRHYGLLRPSWIIADNDTTLISSDCLWLNYQQVLTLLCASHNHRTTGGHGQQTSILNEMSKPNQYLKVLFDDEWFFVSTHKGLLVGCLGPDKMFLSLTCCHWSGWETLWFPGLHTDNFSISIFGDVSVCFLLKFVRFKCESQCLRGLRCSEISGNKKPRFLLIITQQGRAINLRRLTDEVMRGEALRSTACFRSFFIFKGFSLIYESNYQIQRCSAQFVEVEQGGTANKWEASRINQISDKSLFLNLLCSLGTTWRQKKGRGGGEEGLNRAPCISAGFWFLHLRSISVFLHISSSDHWQAEQFKSSSVLTAATWPMFGHSDLKTHKISLAAPLKPILKQACLPGDHMPT